MHLRRDCGGEEKGLSLHGVWSELGMAEEDRSHLGIVDLSGRLWMIRAISRLNPASNNLSASSRTRNFVFASLAASP